MNTSELVEGSGESERPPHGPERPDSVISVSAVGRRSCDTAVRWSLGLFGTRSSRDPSSQKTQFSRKPQSSVAATVGGESSTTPSAHRPRRNHAVAASMLRTFDAATAYQTPVAPMSNHRRNA